MLKNSLLSVAGYVLPALVSIPSLGILAHNLSVEAFGLLSLMMAILGYTGILDFGLTRAVVREVAINRDDREELKAVISTASGCLLGVALIGTLLLELFNPLLIGLFNSSHNMHTELQGALAWLWIAFPLFLMTQLWISLLEGHEDFMSLAKQKTISGVLIAGLPSLAVLYDATLMSAVYGFLCARFASCILAFLAVRQLVCSSGLSFHIHVLRRFVTFGSWLTISNVVGPVMTYLDRFFVSGLLGAKVVAIYTAPAEITSRLTIIPMAILRAIFPLLSRKNDVMECRSYINLSYMLIGVGGGILTIGCVFFAQQIMYAWLGGKYLGDAVLVLQILLFGFLANSIAQIPFTQLHAQGLSKITALIHLMEIIPYLMLLYVCVSNYGVIGAALSWTIRSIFDLILLLCATRFYPYGLSVHQGVRGRG